MALDRLTKVDGGGISTTSDYRVGIITASRFVGPFDGSGGNFSGVVTATNGVFSGNISAVDGNFSGNVTIGGTLTYEDVTNIDSVGIITAQKDIHVGAGLSVVGVGTFGSLDIGGDIDVDGHTNLDNVNIAGVTTTGGNLFVGGNIEIPSSGKSIKIWTGGTQGIIINHGGTYGVIDNLTGTMRISAGQIKLLNRFGNLDMLTCNSFGSVDLFHNNILRFTTTGYGVSTTGLEVVGVSTFSDEVNIGVGLTLGDNVPASFGNSNDLQILHNSSENHFLVNQNTFFKGNVAWGVRNASNQGVIEALTTTRTVDLYGGSLKVLSTTGVGVTIRQGLHIENAEFNMTTNGSKFLDFETGGSNFVNFRHNPSDGSITTFMKAIHGGSLELYDDSDGAVKLTTQSSGVFISGALRLQGTESAYRTGQAQPLIYRSGSTSGSYPFNNYGHLIIQTRIDGSNRDIIFATGSSAANQIVINSSGDMKIPDGKELQFGGPLDSGDGDLRLYHNATDSYISNGTGHLRIGNSHDNKNIKFFTNGSTKWDIDSDGHFIPDTAGAVNIGSTSAEIGHVYLADGKNVYLGSDQDMTMGFDSSNALISLNTGTLSIINYANNEDVKILSDNGGGGVVDYIVADGSTGEVLLNHYGSQKLATSTTGISVTGEVATSQDYPDFEPVLNFNFTGSSTQLDPRLLYRRSAVASFTNANGLVEIVGENTPRFDHDPISRKNKGILIENSRTNNNKSSVYQNNFTGWTLNQFVSQEYSSETAPDGSSNVTLVSASTNSSNHYAYISHSGAAFSGARTVSAWFKKLGTTTYNPQLRIFGVGNGISYANFVLTGDGTVNSGGSDTTAATITPYPNGWYRCTLSWNDSTSHYGGGIVISNNTGAELPTFTGDADITKGFLVYGFQDEAGAYPSSYIPTYGETVSRGADLLAIDGDDSTALSDAYNDQEGTLVVEYHNVITDGSYVATIDDGSGDNRFGISNSNSSQGISVSGGSSQGQLDNGTPIVGATNKMAHAYKLNDRGLSLNGNDATQDNGFALPTGIRFIWIGCRAGSYDFLGSTISRFMYYTKRLPNSQLKLLTSQ